MYILVYPQYIYLATLVSLCIPHIIEYTEIATSFPPVGIEPTFIDS